MAPIVNGLDLALSFLWSCSPKSKAKTRRWHAAKARHLAMLLQRRKPVKQDVPRQCWCESLPAQCVIRPTVKRVCVSENTPFGWAKDPEAGLSSGGLTLPAQAAAPDVAGFSESAWLSYGIVVADPERWPDARRAVLRGNCGAREFRCHAARHADLHTLATRLVPAAAKPQKRVTPDLPCP